MKIKNIVIGSANFGFEKYGIKNKKKYSLNKIKSIISYANLRGINRLDTSMEYTGVYENLSKIQLKKWKVSSKFILSKYKFNVVKNFTKDFDNSLLMLNIKKYENFLFHNIEDLRHKNLSKILKILKTFKKKNLISKIGISLNDPNEIKIVKKKFKPDIVQLPFNLFDRRIVNKKLLKEYNGIEIQVRSIFLQGLLLMKNHARKKNHNKKILKQFDKWINLTKVKRYQACIDFIKDYKFFRTCVIGVGSNSEINKFIKCIKANSKEYPRNILSNDLNIIEPRKWKLT